MRGMRGMRLGVRKYVGRWIRVTGFVRSSSCTVFGPASPSLLSYASLHPCTHTHTHTHKHTHTYVSDITHTHTNTHTHKQYYAGDKARNMLMLNILSECAAVMSAPGLESDQTYCRNVSLEG